MVNPENAELGQKPGLSRQERQGPGSPADLAREQKLNALVTALTDKFTAKELMDPELRKEFAGLVKALLERQVGANQNININDVAKSLEEQFNKLAKLNAADNFGSVIKQLNRICFAKSGPEDLLPFAVDIAGDVLNELSDPSRKIHQGRSLACSVTAREYIKANPVIYAEFIADIVTKGSGHLGRSAGGDRFGEFRYQVGMLGDLKGRTLGMAIYTDILLNNLGSPEEGLMPLDVERFMEARGQAARLMTARTGVSNNPQAIDDIIKAIRSAADQGKAGLISLEFADSGSHGKHVLELCSSKGVPDGYVKLSNPWEPGTPLPDRYQKMVIDNGDGTILIKEKDLKDNLYFAVIETGDKADFGKTAGVKEGAYRKDIPATDDGAELSFFGFSLIRKLKSAADKNDTSENTQPKNDGLSK